MSKPTILVNGEPLAGPLPLFQRWGRNGVRDGRKTQTRRRVKPQPDHVGNAGIPYRNCWPRWVAGQIKCPYGQAGDIRYLREPLRRSVLHDRCVAIYSDDLDMPLPDQREVSLVRSIIEGGPVLAWRWKHDNLSHMHMPREAARTFVKLTDIRCERVQDISHEDIMAEGCPYPAGGGAFSHVELARAWFTEVWEDIHGKGAWALNEWVFVPAWTLLDSPKVEVQS